MNILVFVSFAFTYAFAFSDDFINEINNKQTLWRAGRNFPENITMSDINGIIGVIPLPQEIEDNIPIMYHDLKDLSLPDSFDSREIWPDCKTIKQIYDQSSCNSGWAISVASAMSDRICIHSGGSSKPEISAKYILSCGNFQSRGCNGGNPYYAWLTWEADGVVTGGPYGSKTGCQSYPFAPCDHVGNGTKSECPFYIFDTPKCERTCDNSSNIVYYNDKFYGRTVYTIERFEEQIRAEIFKNGPVVSHLYVYPDFLQYKSGVYQRTIDGVAKPHAIKIIGWGNENNTDYWLIANSWNEDWGDKGFFKIRRGHNECGIEDKITASIPITL